MSNFPYKMFFSGRNNSLIKLLIVIVDVIIRYSYFPTNSIWRQIPYQLDPFIWQFKSKKYEQFWLSEKKQLSFQYIYLANMFLNYICQILNIFGSKKGWYFYTMPL